MGKRAIIVRFPGPAVIVIIFRSNDVSMDGLYIHFDRSFNIKTALFFVFNIVESFHAVHIIRRRGYERISLGAQRTNSKRTRRTLKRPFIISSSLTSVMGGIRINILVHCVSTRPYNIFVISFPRYVS